jgi:serine/threonine protein kinase
MNKQTNKQGPKGDESNEQQLLSFAIQCCSAISLLESNAIIHRDLAARNFLVTGNLEVLLSDFGLSKQLDKEDGTCPILFFCLFRSILCFVLCFVLFLVCLFV